MTPDAREAGPDSLSARSRALIDSASAALERLGTADSEFAAQLINGMEELRRHGSPHGDDVLLETLGRLMERAA